jgi:hypothetical protein
MDSPLFIFPENILPKPNVLVAGSSLLSSFSPLSLKLPFAMFTIFDMNAMTGASFSKEHFERAFLISYETAAS